MLLCKVLYASAIRLQENYLINDSCLRSYRFTKNCGGEMNWKGKMNKKCQFPASDTNGHQIGRTTKSTASRWFFCPAVQSDTWNLSEKPSYLSQAIGCIQSTEELWSGVKNLSWTKCRTLKKKIFWMLKRSSAPCVCQEINL